MSIIWRSLAAVCLLLPFHATAEKPQAANAPIISSGLTEGQVVLTGTAQKADKTFTDVSIQFCIVAKEPGKPTPTSCTSFAALKPAAPSVVKAENGAFSATLTERLRKDEWVYAVQTTTGTVSKLSSEALQVGSVAVPVLTSPTTSPVKSVSGTSQATNDTFSTVDIYICHSAQKELVGKDCTASKDSYVTVDSPSGPAQFASANAQGSFAATLVTPVPAGDSIWLWQIAHEKAGGDSITTASAQTAPAATTVKPTITLPLKAGGSGVSGSATKPTSGDTVTVQLCVKALPTDTCNLTGYTVNVQADGTFTIPHTLREGEIIAVRQSGASGSLDSDPAMVSVPDNERVYIDFTAGVLLSQSENAFSQANLFMGVSVDDAFYRPGWYSQFDPCPSGSRRAATDGLCKKTRHPGLNGFFDVRLTAIPVNSTQTTTTMTTATPMAATSSYDTFLVSRKTAHFEMGTYLPTYFGHTGLPTSALRQAFFVAPVVRFGFNTLVADDGGATTTQTSGGSTTTTSTAAAGVSNTDTKVYSFGVAGVRVGTADLNAGSAHTAEYLDLGVGKFSNLTNLYCSIPASAGGCLSGGSAGPPVVPGTTDPTKEAHYTPYRFLIEGAFDIDGFVLGFSVNKGQNWSGFHRPANVVPNGNITQAPDDVRFLLGYKFDVNKLLSAVTKASKF